MIVSNLQTFLANQNIGPTIIVLRGSRIPKLFFLFVSPTN